MNEEREREREMKHKTMKREEDLVSGSDSDN
jgi:hypothetical protein